MPQFTQKYTIVHFLENVPEGAEFSSSDWPLHVTLVDVFAIDWSVATVIEKLSAPARHYPLATTVAQKDTFLGSENPARVTLLEKTDSLLALHRMVVACLEQGNVRPNSPQYVKDGFLPHVTIQKHARVYEGDTVAVHSLSLIDMFPNEDPYMRKVLKQVAVGYATS